jgi:hypothetical protein
MGSACTAQLSNRSGDAVGPGEAVFVSEELKSLGLSGAIILVLMFVVSILSTAIALMWRNSNKVYGYRLAERDTLNKALTETSTVLQEMLHATEERNDITTEQAELIAKQSSAFELLKVTILAQYDTLKSNHSTTTQTVSAMAEAMRTLHSLIGENRNHYGLQMEAVRAAIQNANHEMRNELGHGNQGLITELRRLIGEDITVVKRRKQSPP